MPAARPVYDVTRPVLSGMPVWPGDAPCRIGWSLRREDGAAANVAEMAMSAHCGTHVDAPFHVMDGGARVGELPLDAFLGPALLVDAGGAPAIDEAMVQRVLRESRPARLLFRTGCWTDPAVFPESFGALTPEAARRLAEAGVLLVGTDAPSVDPFHSESLPAHRALAAAGVVIVENLLLDAVPAGEYELLSLPLRLQEADASPLRALLRPLVL